MSEPLELADEVGYSGKSVALNRGASGVGKYLLLLGGLVGFFGGAAYGTLTFWLADRTGDPGSIIDARLFSPIMGVIAGALGATIGILSGLAAWSAIRLTRSAAGEPRYYLAAALGGIPVTALLSWVLLRNIDLMTFSIASGAGFVAVTTASALLAAHLNARRSHRAAP